LRGPGAAPLAGCGAEPHGFDCNLKGCEPLEITLTLNQSGRRFDRFLAAYLNLAPKSLIQKLLRKKRIKLNGKRATGSEITAVGDNVMFYLSAETLKTLMDDKQKKPKIARNLPISIIYEDDNILLVNKPTGLLTHSNTPAAQDTLISRIVSYLKNTPDFTPSVCNRLDRNTSGIVACGKNMPALQALNAIFANKQVDKIYLALVCGELTKLEKPEKPEQTGKTSHLHGFIIKDEKANRSYILQQPQNGATAVHTEYATQKIINLSGGEKISLVKIWLHTGKSHQIRAHFANIGHPLVGDVKYGAKKINTIKATNEQQTGQRLHCQTLKFHDLPQNSFLHYLTGKKWTAPTPQDFMQI